MRLAFLAPDIDLTGLSGDVAHVLDLTHSLSRAGCMIDLIVGTPMAEPLPANVRLRVVRTRSTFLEGLYLYWALRHERPDVIYERRNSPKLSAMLSLLLRRPYFVEINGLADEEKHLLRQGESAADSLLQKVKRRLRGMLLGHARGIIAVTEGLKERLIAEHGIPAKQILVIRNGVDLSLFKMTPAQTARSALGLPQDRQYVVFVGNLVEWHGVHTLVTAMARVVQRNPNVTLLIVGDGPERSRLEIQVAKLQLEDRVVFAGWVKRESVPTWIAAADICTLTLTIARNASIGSSALKLGEYLACGRAVVATNLPGAGPFVESHGVGLGFRGDDPIDLSARIFELLEDPKRRMDMGHRARELAERELSWERVSTTLLNHFEATKERAPIP